MRDEGGERWDKGGRRWDNGGGRWDNGGGKGCLMQDVEIRGNIRGRRW